MEKNNTRKNKKIMLTEKQIDWICYCLRYVDDCYLPSERKGDRGIELKRGENLIKKLRSLI